MNPIYLNKISVNGLNIDEVIDFDEVYFKNTDILELKKIKVKGSIKKITSKTMNYF